MFIAKSCIYRSNFILYRPVHKPNTSLSFHPVNNSGLLKQCKAHRCLILLHHAEFHSRMFKWRWCWRAGIHLISYPMVIRVSFGSKAH